MSPWAFADRAFVARGVERYSDRREDSDDGHHYQRLDDVNPACPRRTFGPLSRLAPPRLRDRVVKMQWWCHAKKALSIASLRRIRQTTEQNVTSQYVRG